MTTDQPPDGATPTELAAPVRPPSIPTISVVVTTHGRPAGFARAVRAIADQAVAAGPSDLRIVVVYDGCHPYADVDLELIPLSVNVLRNPFRTGIAAARNTALDTCDTDVIAFLDDDAVPDPLWLSSLLSGLAAYPDLLCFGGRVRRLQPDHRLLPRLRDEVYYRETFGAWYLDRTATGDFRGPPYVNGGNCAYRREVFATYGGFRPDLPAYVDVEFGHRVNCRSTGVLLAGFDIGHDHPDQLRGYLRRCFTSGQARARLRHSCPGNGSWEVGASIARNLVATNFARARRFPGHRARALGVLTLQEVVHAAGYVRR